MTVAIWCGIYAELLAAVGCCILLRKLQCTCRMLRGSHEGEELRFALFSAQ